MTPVHVRLREWQTVGPETEELRDRNLGGDGPRELARRLGEAGVVEVTELRNGLRVRALAHVGRIQLGSVLITIEPKVGTTELLQLLRYAYGFRNLKLFEQTEFAHTGQLLQDLLAHQLLAEVTELTSRGLSRQYVPRTEELGSPRGRIDIGALARGGPRVRATVVCRHHLRSADHDVNRAVRAGLELAASVAQDADLRRSLFRLHARLGLEIQPVRLSVDSLARARRQINRLTTAYEPSLRLVELVYACAAVSFDGETTTKLPGFLFDMNRFFQALLGRFLSDHLPGYSISEEHSLTDMMRYLPGLNPRRRRAPAPRPDFVVMKGTRVVCLIDAKYRDLWEHELPREMLYQLAIYALSQPGAATATILFPSVARNATPAVVEIRDPVRPSPLGYVALRPAILPELVDALHRARPACEELASRLAFGTSRSGATSAVRSPVPQSPSNGL